MKKTLILISAIFLQFSSAAIAQEIPTIDVAERCKFESKAECDGSCVDGWSQTCYFDANSKKVESNIELELQKDKCFAFFDSSICAPCKNDHLLNFGGALKKVSCEEFYSALKQKFKDCSGCLQSVMSAS